MLKWQTTPSPCSSFHLSDASFEKSNNSSYTRFNSPADSTKLERLHFSFEQSTVDRLTQEDDDATYSTLTNDRLQIEYQNLIEENELAGGSYFEQNSLSAECMILKCPCIINALEELRQWFQTMTGDKIPKVDFVRSIHEGLLLRQFMLKITGETFYARLKRARRSKPWKCVDNIVYFLKECKKLGLKDDQLFTAFDLHYVVRPTDDSFYEVEWNMRLKKVMKTFSWLSSRLREQKKYEKFVRGNNLDSLSHLTSKEHYEYSSTSKPSADLLNNKNSDNDDKGILLSQSASLRTQEELHLKKHLKTVTFKDKVLKHHCSVENIAKPYFHVVKKELPNYQEYLNMRSSEENASMLNNHDESVQYLTFSPKSYLETGVLKDTNNNERKGKLSPRSPRFKSFISSMTSPRSTLKVDRSNTAKISRQYTSRDAGHSKASQNGETLNKTTKLLPSNRLFESNPVSFHQMTKSTKYNTISTPSEIYKMAPVETHSKNNNLLLDPVSTPVGFHTAPREHIRKDVQSYTLPNDYQDRNNYNHLNDQNSFKKTLCNDNNSKHICSPNCSNLTRVNDSFKSNILLPTYKETTSQRTRYQPPSERLKLVHRTDELTENELKDLNALLDEFGEDKIQSAESNADDEILVEQQETLTDVANQICDRRRPALCELDDNNELSRETNVISDNKLFADLEDVLKDLLSVESYDNSFSVEKHKCGNLNRIQNISRSNKSLSSKQDLDSHFDSIVDTLRQAIDPSDDHQKDSNEGEHNIDILSDSIVSEISSKEGTDSGIDETGIDETMPSLMKDSKSQGHHSKQHKSKEKKSKNKHGEDKKQKHSNFSSENNSKNQSHRSESEPRRLKKVDKNDEHIRSNSASRRDDLRSAKSTNHEGESNERSGRPKERYPFPSNEKGDKRRSRYDIDGVTANGYKRWNTDGTNPSKNSGEHYSPRSPIAYHEPKAFMPQDKNLYKQSETNWKPEKNTVMQNNDNVSNSLKEYMWDTADGKHRVYMRQPKSEDPKPFSKKEPQADYHIHSNDKTARAKHNFEEELGVTPDMLRLLQEEERFWQKQLELKKWRKSRDQKENHGDHSISNGIYEEISPRDRHRSNASNYADQNKSRELEREANEERVAMEANRLMKIRAQQEHLLKASRENLLRDDSDNSKTQYLHGSFQPISQPKHNKESRQSFPPAYHNTGKYRDFPDHQLNCKTEHSTQSHHNVSPENQNQITLEKQGSKRLIKDPSTIEKNYKSDRGVDQGEVLPFTLSDRSRENSWIPQDSENRNQNNHFSTLTNSPRSPQHHTQDRSTTLYSNEAPTNNQPRSHSFGSKPLLSPTRTNSTRDNKTYNCFSDDDEVFQKKRHQRENPRSDDHRGYFSDYEPVRDSMDKTYLARPLIRQKKSQLRCTACCKIISDDRLMHVEGQNYYWHLKCFLCTVCRAFLNDKHAIRVRIVQYNLHCRFCYSAQDGDQLCSEV